MLAHVYFGWHNYSNDDSKHKHMRWFGGQESDNVKYGSGGGNGGKIIGGGIGAL
jgi:hypothetical protein